MRFRQAIDWALGRKAVEQAGAELRAKVAAYMAERARMYCPVDTGELLASIGVITSKTGGNFHVVATAPHAQWVEFGHMTVAGSFVPPNPFMRNAMADAAAAFPSIAGSVRIRRPDGPGSEAEPARFTDVQHLGVSF